MSSRLAYVRARAGLAIACAAAIAAAAVSCGSRTGLFAPDDCPGCGLDASPDGPIAQDSSVPCVPGRFTFDLALTQLMFVIDRSRSMTFDLQGNEDPPERDTRWRILQRSLAASITRFDQQISMGAKFFPEEIPGCEPRIDSAASCLSQPGVAIPPSRGNARRILDVFDGTAPCGGTPTADAVRIAAQYLTSSRSVARTIVLATDGAPNCNAALDNATCICTSAVGAPACRDQGRNGRFSCLDDTQAVDTIRQVAEVQKIPVYVIGLGGTEKPEFLRVLDDMAVAGGRARPTVPRHYNVSSPAELDDALETIRDTVAKCTYLTPSAPKDPNSLAVEIDGVPIRRDQSKQNGWDWIDQPLGELAFFGDACRRAQVSSSTAIVAGVVQCGE